MNLPREVLLNLPLITISGKDEILIENHKGIISADETLLKVKSTCGIIKLEGENLYIKEISPDFVKVAGKLEKLEFLI